MRNLRRFTLLMAAASASSFGLGAAFIGCSGDDSNPTQDSGAQDSTADVVARDSTGDVRSDVSVGIDAQDAPTQGSDAAHDAADATVDTGIGTATDASDAAHPLDAADAGDGGHALDASDAAHISDAADASDALDAAAPSDASDASDAPVLSPAAGFPTRVAEAYCTRLRQCCLRADGGAADAGFDMGFCVASTEQNGGVNGNGLSLYDPVLMQPGVHVTFDQTMATQCLQDNAALPCDTVTSATFLQLRNDCYGAIVGAIPLNGTGCTSAIECANGAFCSPATDGGAGTCVMLAGDGGACLTNDECAYRGSGVPAQYCNNQGFDDAGAIGSNTCLPRGAMGASCGLTPLYNQECSSELCVADSVSPTGGSCGTATVLSDPGVSMGICESNIPRDAGTD